MSGDPALDREDRMVLLDWYKNLTTLSLLIMGGIVGVLPRPLPSYGLVALALEVAGGVAAFGVCRNLLPGAPAERSRQLRSLRWTADNAVASGVGLFVGGYAAGL